MSRPSRPTRASSSIGWTSRRWIASTAFHRPSPSTRPTRCAPLPTVGTMTELNDHLKLLFACRHLHCGTAASPCVATMRKAFTLTPRAAPPLSAIRACTSASRWSFKELQGSRSPRVARTTGLLAHPRALGDTLEVVGQPAPGTAERACRSRSRRHCASGAAANMHLVDESPSGIGAEVHRTGSIRASRIARNVICRIAIRCPAVLVQLAGGRLRNLPRIRPHHRHRLWPRGARRTKTLAGGVVKPWRTVE